jgi:inner membrane protein involved in colicin E2 resistance
MIWSIETTAVLAQLLIPIFAVIGMWVVRVLGDSVLRAWSERFYFALLMLVAFGTMRTMLANDDCWLLHTASLSMMVVGAIFPNSPTTVLDT